MRKFQENLKTEGSLVHSVRPKNKNLAIAQED